MNTINLSNAINIFYNYSSYVSSPSIVKKMTLIAVVSFGALAACYLIVNRCMRERDVKLNDIEQENNDSIVSQLNQMNEKQIESGKYHNEFEEARNDKREKQKEIKQLEKRRQQKKEEKIDDAQKQKELEGTQKKPAAEEMLKAEPLQDAPIQNAPKSLKSGLVAKIKKQFEEAEQQELLKKAQLENLKKKPQELDVALKPKLFEQAQKQQEELSKQEELKKKQDPEKQDELQKQEELKKQAQSQFEVQKQQQQFKPQQGTISAATAPAAPPTTFMPVPYTPIPGFSNVTKMLNFVNEEICKYGFQMTKNTDFLDGRALCALADIMTKGAFLDDNPLLLMTPNNFEQNKERMAKSLEALTKAGIPNLLDLEDIIWMMEQNKIEAQSMYTYLLGIYIKLHPECAFNK